MTFTPVPPQVQKVVYWSDIIDEAVRKSLEQREALLRELLTKYYCQGARDFVLVERHRDDGSTVWHFSTKQLEGIE